MQQIAEAVDVHVEVVGDFLARARKRGEPRASRPYRSRRDATAEARARVIVGLFGQGWSCRAIAEHIGVNTRLVQMRVREASL